MAKKQAQILGPYHLTMFNFCAPSDKGTPRGKDFKAKAFLTASRSKRPLLQVFLAASRGTNASDAVKVLREILGQNGL